MSKTPKDVSKRAATHSGGLEEADAAAEPSKTLPLACSDARLTAHPAGGHTPLSAVNRLFLLLTEAGMLTTFSMFACAFEDSTIGLFDWKYGVKTSGYIAVEDTSFDAKKVSHATGYAPVNAWALPRLLQNLSLPKSLRFADFGCGLGRACIIAAEYGFSRVTGVDLAPEFCAAARANILKYQKKRPSAPPMHILQADVLDYCNHTDDDVFFMFRPFSYEFTGRVLKRLADRADHLGKTFTVIYTEKIMMKRNYAEAFLEERRFRPLYDEVILGQSFHVRQCGRAA